MNKSKFLIMFFTSIILFSSCEEEEAVLTKGEKNAQMIAEILEDNSIQFVEINEFDWTESDWRLAADNQLSTSDKSRFSVEGTYFVLDGTGSKTYNMDNTPTHQTSGFYYFDLEYLVSFDISPNKDKLFLYLSY